MRLAGWMVLALGLNPAWMLAQEKTAEPLTLPAYHNQPTTEGYFPGAGGVRLFYRTVGRRGDPILFLHGGPGLGIEDGGYDMEPLTEEGFRLLMFNERGAGRSEIITDASKLRIQDFVADVEEFRKKFGLERFGLIGLSWGSGVALEYAAQYPERVTRVIFLSPMPLTAAFAQERSAHLDSLKTDKEREREKEALEKLAKAKDAEVPSLCEAFFGSSKRLYLADIEHEKRSRMNLCTMPAAGLRNFPVVARAAAASLGDWDFRPLLKKLRIPALIVEGAETNVPLGDTREWAKSAPNGRLLLIPHAGHQNWVDQPEAVFSAMAEFFRGKWPAGSE